MNMTSLMAERFLKVLALFEKLEVIDSVEAWQLCRTARNLAAHDYETDYALNAEHSNELQALLPVPVGAAARLLALSARSLPPIKVETLLGDPSKAKAKLGWAPKRTRRELVAEMVQVDYRSAQRDSLVKRAGYRAYDNHE